MRDKIDVAFGVPERSVTEAALLDALRAVAVNFDESPDEMHAALGPAGSGVRWFTFACTRFRRGRVLAERHFWQIMERDLPELLLVATSGYGREPWLFEAGGTKLPSLLLRVLEDDIAVYRSKLPRSARRDGDVAEVGLGALDLPIARPLEALTKATHEVRLRTAGKVPRSLSIRALKGPVLPCRIAPESSLEAHPPKERFRCVDRLADTSQLAEMAAAVERAGIREDGAPRKLALAYGSTVVPALVSMLEQPDLEPSVTNVCLETLARVGAAPEAMFPWVLRGRSAREIACGTLARLGETARHVLETNATSTDTAARSAAKALLELLDDPRYEPLRKIGSARDKISSTVGPQIDQLVTLVDTKAAEQPMKRIFAKAGPLGAGAVAHALRAAFDQNGNVNDWCIIEWAQRVDNAAWAVASHLVERPQLETMATINAARCLGESFRAVAEQLLTYEPLSDDPVLMALAAGRPSPSMDEAHKIGRARGASDPRLIPKKKTPAKKTPAEKTKSKRP